MNRKREMKQHTMLLLAVAVFVLVLIGKEVFKASWTGSAKVPKEETSEQGNPNRYDKSTNDDKYKDDDKDDDDDDDDDDEDDSHSGYGKRIELVSKSKLEEATGQTLTFNNVSEVQKAMTKTSVWESLGFSKADAKNIVERIKHSPNQTRGILRGISKKDYLSFKVILVDNGHVNIGKQKDR